MNGPGLGYELTNAKVGNILGWVQNVKGTKCPGYESSCTLQNMVLGYFGHRHFGQGCFSLGQLGPGHFGHKNCQGCPFWPFAENNLLLLD